MSVDNENTERPEDRTAPQTDNLRKMMAKTVEAKSEHKPNAHNPSNGWRTRFAPSPTGHLHLGHAYSALCVWASANKRPENFVLRIDDLDHTRCRSHYTKQILDDLDWLGIQWAETPPYQSTRLQTYADALTKLREMDLVYPCYLTRTEISTFLSAPHHTPDMIPSTRGKLSASEEKARQDAGNIPAWRLDMTKALARTGPLSWQGHDGAIHAAEPGKFGDIILARKDIQASYHLSVVLDDAADNISLVVRGDDLTDATHIHRLLQTLLNLPTPHYYHHKLVRDETGKRLAKRDDAQSLLSYRNQGLSLDNVIKMLPDFPENFR